MRLKNCRVFNLSALFATQWRKGYAFWGLAPFATQWRKGYAFWGLAPFATQWRKGAGV